MQEFFSEYEASPERIQWRWERLPYAIENGYVDIAEFFILKGDPINSYTVRTASFIKQNQVDIYYKHPLITAVRKDYLSLVQLIANLCENISEINEYKDIYVDNPHQHYKLIIQKKNAFHVAITDCEDSYGAVIALLEAGFKVNLKYSYYTYDINSPPIWGSESFTPLKLAISYKKGNIIKALIDAEADIDYCGDSSDTPLYQAVKDNYLDAVLILLNAGANPLKLCNGQDTPLQLAMRMGYWDIVDLLLESSTRSSIDSLNLL